MDSTDDSDDGAEVDGAEGETEADWIARDMAQRVEERKEVRRSIVKADGAAAGRTRRGGRRAEMDSDTSHIHSAVWAVKPPSIDWIDDSSGAGGRSACRQRLVIRRVSSDRQVEHASEPSNILKPHTEPELHCHWQQQQQQHTQTAALSEWT